MSSTRKLKHNVLLNQCGLSLAKKVNKRQQKRHVLDFIKQFIARPSTENKISFLKTFMILTHISAVSTNTSGYSYSQAKCAPVSPRP